MTSADPDTPYRGHFVGQAHHFAAHVYFEDTDFSGLVYHANFLRYMERARSDMLSCAGIDQSTAWKNGEGVYAIADLSIKYARPAHFDDDLLVITTIRHIAGASVIMQQDIMRGDELLTTATLKAAFLSLDGKPKRQPAAWTQAFAKYLVEQPL